MVLPIRLKLVLSLVYVLVRRAFRLYLDRYNIVLLGSTVFEYVLDRCLLRFVVTVTVDCYNVERVYRSDCCCLLFYPIG